MKNLLYICQTMAWCDKCKRSEISEFEKYRRPPDQEKEHLDEGWCDRDGQTLCPDCAKEVSDGTQSA